VDAVGRQVLTANPQLGMRPLFRTIGAPQAEVFHRGTTEIDVTEGLVKQCGTDGQLAAVLCTELGKMVAEREALAGARARTPEREPPMDVRIGNDYAGPAGSPDQTHLAELGKYDRERRRAVAPPPPPPDPQSLANTYLTKAGFPATDLDAVAPLLKLAAEHSTFEKQMTNAPPPAGNPLR